MGCDGQGGRRQLSEVSGPWRNEVNLGALIGECVSGTQIGKIDLGGRLLGRGGLAENVGTVETDVD